MTTGRPPFSEYTSQVSALFHIASSKAPPPLPDCLSPEGRDFLRKCMNRDARARPTAAELLEHPFASTQVPADYKPPPPEKPAAEAPAAAAAPIRFGAEPGEVVRFGTAQAPKTNEAAAAAPPPPAVAESSSPTPRQVLQLVPAYDAKGDDGRTTSGGGGSGRPKLVPANGASVLLQPLPAWQSAASLAAGHPLGAARPDLAGEDEIQSYLRRALGASEALAQPLLGVTGAFAPNPPRAAAGGARGVLQGMPPLDLAGVGGVPARAARHAHDVTVTDFTAPTPRESVTNGSGSERYDSTIVGTHIAVHERERAAHSARSAEDRRLTMKEQWERELAEELARQRVEQADHMQTLSEDYAEIVRESEELQRQRIMGGGASKSARA